MTNRSAKSPFELWAEHVDACMQAYAAHHRACIEFWCRAWCLVPHGGTGVIPFDRPTGDLVLEIDQRSEMGGPTRLPELDRPPSTTVSRAFAATSPAFPVSDVCVRILRSGEAWVALVSLADVAPGLPPGDYPIDALGATFIARRMQRTEGSLEFGEGAIPGELLADASLGLDIFSATPTL